MTVCVASWVFANAILWFLRSAWGVSLPTGPRVLIVDGTLLAALALVCRVGDVRASDFGLRGVPVARAVRLILLAFLALAAIDGLLSVTARGGHSFNPLHGVSTASPIVVVLTGLAASITAPVVEELFFRGFIYRCFRNRLSTLPASVISGAMFAAVHTHYPAAALPAVAWFGVVACLLYDRTGSIVPGIALHSVIDASGFEIALTGRTIVVPSLVLLSVSGILIASVGKVLIELLRAKRGVNGPCVDTDQASAES